MNKNSQEIYNNLSVSHSVSNETTPSAPSNRISKCFTRIDPVQISQYWKVGHFITFIISSLHFL